MQFSFDIQESNAEIFRLVANSIADELNDALIRAALPLEKDIRKLVSDAIQAQPEWFALQGGKLTEEFGLTHHNAKINTILKIWMNSIVVLFDKFTLRGSQLRGKFEISMIKADWSDVLSAPEAKQITKKGQALAWLDWLLLQGNKVIIRDYDIGYGHKPGRAGGKIMIKNRGRWSVPPEYAGTTNDNFVTRAIDSIAPQFEQLFISNVISRL